MRISLNLMFSFEKLENISESPLGLCVMITLSPTSVLGIQACIYICIYYHVFAKWRPNDFMGCCANRGLATVQIETSGGRTESPDNTRDAVRPSANALCWSRQNHSDHFASRCQNESILVCHNLRDSTNRKGTRLETVLLHGTYCIIFKLVYLGVLY